MFIRYDLIQLLNKEDLFYIYGLGEFATMLYNMCKQWELTNKLKGFVLSIIDDSTPKMNNNIPVIHVSELKNDTNTLVIIATNYKFAEQIEKNLVQLDVKNYLFLFNFIGGLYGQQYKQDPFNLESFKQFCKSIADWYISSNFYQGESFNNIVNKIYNIGLKRKQNKTLNQKSIMFISQEVYPRDNKIFQSLKKLGYKINILVRGKSDRTLSNETLENAGIHIKRCLSDEEIFYYSLISDASIFMVDRFEGYAQKYTIYFMLIFKDYFGKIIFCPYDIIHGQTDFQSAITYKTERYALENSDGVIFRYLDQINYLKDNFNINIKGKTLQFFDYCEEVSPLNSFQNEKNNILKIAYVASNINLTIKREINKSEYSHEASVDDMLKILGNRDDVELHLFAWYTNEHVQEHLKNLKLKYNNFYFKIRTKHEELLKLLTQFDYLTELYNKRKIPKWPISIEGYNENCYLNSVPNKYFDAISSGIAIIGNTPIKIVKYFENYDVIANMTLDELDVEYLKANKEKYKKNAKIARNELLIDKHIYKLVNFLDEIVKGEKDEI